MNWKTQTVLVTGAGGFIGSHLTERLVQLGAKTRALIRYNSSNSWGWLDKSPITEHMDVVLGDVRDRESLQSAMKGVDIVFHLAALIGIPYSYHSPLSYVRTNVEGTANVLQVALESGVKRVVQTSSSEVYGTAQYVPIDERHPLNAQSPYAASKIAADQLGLSFHRSFGLPVTILRPFNTFGPRQSARAVIPTIITQCLTLQTLKLGNLSPTRDLTYVTDVVEGFVRSAQADAAGHVVNLGTGQEMSIGDLAALIVRLTGRSVRLETESTRVRPEPSEVERLCANAETARKVLNWQPSVTLEEGLGKTIEWFREHLDGYHANAYVV